MSASKNQRGAGRWLRHHWIWPSAVLLLAALLGIGYWIAAAALERYLHSQDLREKIGEKTARELSGTAGVLPLSWDELTVFSPALLIQCKPPRALTEVRARSLTAHCKVDGLWRGKLRISKMTVEAAEAAYGKAAAGELSLKLPERPELEQPSTEDSAMTMDISEVEIGRTSLFWGDPEKSGGGLREVRSRYFPDGKNLSIKGEGGTFRQSGWPEAKIANCELYYAKPVLEVKKASLAIGKKGDLGVTGKFTFGDQPRMDLQLRFEQCPIGPFLGKTARSKIEGRFNADCSLAKELGKVSPAESEGEAEFEDVVVRNVEGLEKTAAFTGIKRFAEMKLSHLSGKYRWKDSKLRVKEFQLTSPELLRVNGSFTFEDGEIDGTFQVGTTGAVLEKFPGARERVFTKTRDGYFWTEVNVHGPISKPENDLKPRLVSAAKAHYAEKLLAPILKPGAELIKLLERLF